MNTIMNKIFKLSLLLLALPLLMTSCLKNDDEVFGDSSSKRLQKALEEARTVLRSSEKGWVMDYYIGDNSSYGGYAFVVKFDSLTVTASSELSKGASTSYYKLTTDNGPVLTFDTYNDVFHALATPSQSNYEGKHADYEFQIVSATSDLVVLRGRRTNNLVYLHPLTTSPKEYLAKVADTEKKFIVASLSADVDGKNVSAEFDINNRQVSFYSTTDSTFSKNCAFTFTDTGVRFNSSVEAYGKTLSNLSFDPETMTFTSNDKGSEQLAIKGHLPADYVYYDQIPGDYVFRFQKNDGEKYVDLDVDVTLTPNEDQSGFVMNGVIDGYGINLNYDKAKGILYMVPQPIGKVSSGNMVWMYGALFEGESGSISEVGMQTLWNKDLQNPVLTWNPIETLDTPTNSYIFVELTTAGEFVGQYRGSEITFAGNSTMLHVKSLTKKTPFTEHQK